MNYSEASQIVIDAARAIQKRDRVNYDVAWSRLQAEKPKLLTALEVVRKRELANFPVSDTRSNLRRTMEIKFPGRGLGNNGKFIDAALAEIERRYGDIDWYELLQVLKSRFPSLLSFVEGNDNDKTK